MFTLGDSITRDYYPEGGVLRRTDRGSQHHCGGNIVAARKIPTNDLNAAARGHPEYHNDNIHFNSQGVHIQAAQVSAEVQTILPR